MGDKITFSFGENWSRYVRTVDDAKIARAEADIRDRLGAGSVAGKSVLDVGSGSGVHSLAFHRLGAKCIRSFDVDPASVSATAHLRERYGAPANWSVSSGSILDPRFVKRLGQFDVVYSWGVLHHTGAMWQAIANAAELVAPGGALWIALYRGGPRYEHDLSLKRRFNASSVPLKWATIGREVLRQMWGKVREGRSPLGWNAESPRGMSVYYDLWDWYGGLPYEVATPEEVETFLSERGFRHVLTADAGEGACATYVYRRSN